MDPVVAKKNNKENETQKETRPDTRPIAATAWHRLPFISIFTNGLETYGRIYGPTDLRMDGRTDGRTRPLIEMQSHLKKK